MVFPTAWTSAPMTPITSFFLSTVKPLPSHFLFFMSLPHDIPFTLVSHY